jgi:glycosyltransferase involved in cell wall biosynthesis
MKVVFYLDRVMHYHESTFREIERRLESEAGAFFIVSGQPRYDESGRVGVSKIDFKRHIFVPYHEWRRGTYTVRWQPTLAKIVRQLAPDVVIVMGHVGCLTYWRLGSLSKRAGFKYVTWQCGYEYNPNRIKRFLTRKFLRQFHYHLAYHSEAKTYLLNHGIRQSRIAVVHNTINEQEIDLVPQDEARRQIATMLGLPLERPIVLYVGAVLVEKRLDLLVAAVRLLEPNAVSLIIVGDGPALDELKSSSADLNYVKYPGRVIKGVGCFFDAADVFVLPGTGGLAINEAMAHGLPIIAAHADGSADDLITNGLNGYILKEGQPDEIAGHLKNLLSDPESRLRMGRASRGLITKKYSFRNFIDRVMKGLHAASRES